MLVLTRKKNEEILIGDDIRIMVVEFCDGGTKVRIGIEAPRDVRVDRAEVRRRMEAAMGGET